MQEPLPGRPTSGGPLAACVRHDAQRHDLALDNWLAKATQEVTCRVEVPVEAPTAGTTSRTARVSVARRNLKGERDQGGSVNEGKLPARGTRTAYEASSWWARGPVDSKPNAIRTDSAYMRRVCGRKVTRLTLRDLPSCLVLAASRDVAMRWQKSAEAIVVAGVP